MGRAQRDHHLSTSARTRHRTRPAPAVCSKIPRVLTSYLDASLTIAASIRAPAWHDDKSILRFARRSAFGRLAEVRCLHLSAART